MLDSLYELFTTLSNKYYYWTNQINLRLLDAVRSNNIVKAQELIFAGANVNYCDPDTKESPLVAATKKGHYHMIEHLLRLEARINLPAGYHSNTALNAALVAKDEDIFEQLMCNGALLTAASLEITIREGYTIEFVYKLVNHYLDSNKHNAISTLNHLLQVCAQFNRPQYIRTLDSIKADFEKVQIAPQKATTPKFFAHPVFAAPVFIDQRPMPPRMPVSLLRKQHKSLVSVMTSEERKSAALNTLINHLEKNSIHSNKRVTWVNDKENSSSTNETIQLDLKKQRLK